MSSKISIYGLKFGQRADVGLEGSLDLADLLVGLAAVVPELVVEDQLGVVLQGDKASEDQSHRRSKQRKPLTVQTQRVTTCLRTRLLSFLGRRPEGQETDPASSGQGVRVKKSPPICDHHLLPGPLLRRRSASSSQPGGSRASVLVSRPVGWPLSS